MKTGTIPMSKEPQQYKSLAKKKPIYICAPTLDTYLKLTAVKGSTMKSLGWGKEDLIELFTNQASRFNKPVIGQDLDVKIIDTEA